MTLLEKVKANLILEHSADDVTFAAVHHRCRKLCRELPASFPKAPIDRNRDAAHHRTSRDHAVVPLL